MKRQLACAAVACLLLAAGQGARGERVLFDFEEEAGVKAWENVDVYALREAEAKAAYDLKSKAATNPATLPVYKALVSPAKEPAVKVEWSGEGASRGAGAMKLTFGGGRMPTVGTVSPVRDWREYKSFRAEVTATRTCMVVFRAMRDTSKYGTGYNDGVSRWEFAARCEKGKNVLVTPMPKYPESWNKITRVEIYLFEPKEGESITVDNVRLSTEKAAVTSAFNEAPPLPEKKFSVAGTTLVVQDVNELADKLKDQWVKPVDKTVEQVEAEIQGDFEKIKKEHPKAVMVMLREGQKGYDPANPEKAFAGWADAGTPSHLPMGLTLGSFHNAGGGADIETCFRNRAGFLRVDLSSIPAGAKILAARLVVSRGMKIGKGWETSPAMFVAEPLNRPWKENEVTVFEPAKGELWKDYSAQSWGEDGDAAAVFLAHGPSNGVACSWDFTEAVKYWTQGKHANHGFTLHGAAKYVDYLHIKTKEAAAVKDRPLVAVVYEQSEP